MCTRVWGKTQHKVLVIDLSLTHHPAGMAWVEAYVKDEVPELKRDSIMYMLHGDLGEDNTTPKVTDPEVAGDNWIVSGPHLMLLPKDPSSLKKYPTDFNIGEPYTMMADTEYAHLMIPMY